MLYTLILIVHVFVSFVLIAVILLQAGRGGGLSDSFGGGAAQSMFGTRGAVYLTRATTVCATVFMLTSLSLAVGSVQRGRSLMEHAAPKAAPVQAVQKPAAPTESAPPFKQETAPAEKK